MLWRGCVRLSGTAGREKTMTVPRPRSRPRKPLDAGVFQPEIGSFRLHLAAEGKAARTVRTYTKALHPGVRPGSQRATGSGSASGSPGPGTDSRDELPGSPPPAEPGIRRCAPLRSHSGEEPVDQRRRGPRWTIGVGCSRVPLLPRRPGYHEPPAVPAPGDAWTRLWPMPVAQARTASQSRRSARPARPDPGHRSARARRMLAGGPPGRPSARRVFETASATSRVDPCLVA